MALFKLDINRVTGRGAHLYDGTGIRMINGLGIYDLIDSDTGGRFEYVLNLETDREGITSIDTAFSATAIAGYVNAGFVNTFITLSVYPESNPTATPVSELFLSKNISLGYDFSGGSILYIKSGVELNRVLVQETIDEILEVTTEDTIEWDDGVDYFRLQVRGGYLNLDQTITPTGFSGTQGVDWNVIWSISYS